MQHQDTQAQGHETIPCPHCQGTGRLPFVFERINRVKLDEQARLRREQQQQILDARVADVKRWAEERAERLNRLEQTIKNANAKVELTPEQVASLAAKVDQ